MELIEYEEQPLHPEDEDHDRDNYNILQSVSKNIDFSDFLRISKKMRPN